MEKITRFFSLLRDNFTLNPAHLFFLFRHALTLTLLNIETRGWFRRIYGDFNWERNCRSYRLLNPGSEGGAILGEVVMFAKSVDVKDGKILLAGDRREVKAIWSPYFPSATIITAGIHDMDYEWNFEHDPPKSLKELSFDLIISQATLEHLVDPYKHVRDLVSMLNVSGTLVVHSVLPGFFYHRVPIDCLRFYPDWFEEVGKRMNLRVIDKQIQVFNITYKFQRITD